MSLAAALFVALLVALLVGLALGWRWFTVNRDRLAAQIEARWRRALASAPMQRLRARNPRAWAFVGARFARGEYLGLHLTVGFAICVAALAAFGAIAEDVINHDPITEFDADLVHWFNRHATPTGYGICEAISALGSPLTVALLALGVAILLGARRQWILLGGWLATLIGGSALDQGLKLMIRRPRPSQAGAVGSLGWSFPSGHAMESLVVYGMLTYVIALLWVQRPSVRTWVVTGAAVLVVSIGLSRLYLGVHYFSDIVGGYAMGVLWLSACLSGLEVVRRWQGVRSTPPAG